MEPLTKKRLVHKDVLRFGASLLKFKFVATKQEKAEAACSDSEGEVDLRKAHHFQIPKLPSEQYEANLPNYGRMQIEDRLMRSEQQIQMLLGKQSQAVSVQGDKEITIRQIVEDERKLIEQRYQKDMERLQKEKDNELLTLAKDSSTNKTQN